jgi:hypothetical protein
MKLRASRDPMASFPCQESNFDRPARSLISIRSNPSPSIADMLHLDVTDFDSNLVWLTD